MLWVDYREKLGIGLTDIEKFKLLKSKVVNYFYIIEKIIPYDHMSHFEFCMMVGLEYKEFFPAIRVIIEKLSKSNQMQEFLSLYIAFVNTFQEVDDSDLGKREVFVNVLRNLMDTSKIGHEIHYDKKKNQHFIFPQGIPEFDKALVSATLEWLDDYPASQKIYITALRQYADGEFIRDVADNFRKSLEDFLKEFFNNSKNLTNNIKEVGTYLKAQGGDSEITNILVGLISCYDTLNNKIAKHNDKVDSRFLEFLMYQTGLFIRMLIVVKRAEKRKAE